MYISIRQQPVHFGFRISMTSSLNTNYMHFKNKILCTCTKQHPRLLKSPNQDISIGHYDCLKMARKQHKPIYWNALGQRLINQRTMAMIETK